MSLSGDDVTLSVSAGGELVAFGAVERLTTRLTAGGTVDASEVTARSAVVHASAGGTTFLRVSDEVTGLVKSGSVVHVFGAPPRRSVATASGGEITCE